MRQGEKTLSAGIAATGGTHGGFSFGAKYIDQLAVQRSNESTPSPLLPAAKSALLPTNADGQLAQQLQRLSKRDATTRVKALQALRQLVLEESSDDVLLIIPHWAFLFAKLVMDSSRGVRAEAANTMAAIASVTGRALAPFLGAIYPPWFLSQYDESPEVRNSAVQSMESRFPGVKAREAVLFCRVQIVFMLLENLRSTPASLADVRKESPEEIQDRHDRVLVATCYAIGSLANILKDIKAEDERGRVIPDIERGLSSLLTEFIANPKSNLQSKAMSVRRASYELVSSISKRAPQLITKDMLSTLSPIVLGAFGEQDPTNHSAMWGAVLSLATAHPGAWDSVNLNKAILPRLWSLLRHGCFGSGLISYPAMLPLLTVLPPSSVNNLIFFESLVNALWDGIHYAGSVEAENAAGEACQECLMYGLLRTEVDQSSLVRAMLAHGILPSAFGALTEARMAKRTVLGVLRRLSEMPNLLQVVVDAVAAYAVEAIGQAIIENKPGSPAFAAVENLLDDIAKDTSHDAAQQIATAVGALVLQSVHTGHLVGDETCRKGIANTATHGDGALGELTAMLAYLWKTYPQVIQCLENGYIAEAGSDMHEDAPRTLTYALQRLIEDAEGGVALQASCDLLASCLAADLNPSKQISIAILELCSSTRPAVAAQLIKCLAAGRGPALASAHCQELDDLCEYLHSSDKSLPWKHGEDALIEALIAGNGEASMLTEAGQAAVLHSLSCTVHSAQNEDRSVQGLSILANVLFLPFVKDNTALTAPHLSCLTAALEVLADESIAIALAGTDAQSVSSVESDSENEVASEKHHTEMYRLALSMWSRKEDLGPLFSQAIELELERFIQSAVTILISRAGQGGVADAALAFVLQMVLGALGTAHVKVLGIMLRKIWHAKANSPLFLHLVESLEPQLVLEEFGDEAAGVTIELLSGFENSIESPLRSQVLSYLVKRESLLLNVLEDAWWQGRSRVFSLVFSAAVQSNADDKDLLAGTTALFFRERILVCTDDVDSDFIVDVLHGIVPVLRSQLALVQSHGLDEFTQQACTEAAARPTHSRAVHLAGACFYVPDVAPTYAATFSGKVHQDQVLEPGTDIWYSHSDGKWEAAKVVSVDRTIAPPSFSVLLSNGIRDTERKRLRKRQMGDDVPPHALVMAPSGDCVADVFCTDSERESLLGLLRACFTVQEAPSEVLWNGVVYCWLDMTEQDWQSVLAGLGVAIKAAAEGAAAAVSQIASLALSTAVEVAGTSFQDPEAALDFFRRVARRQLLPSSDIILKAADSMATRALDALHEILCSDSNELRLLLQTYSQVAGRAFAARALPIYAWERSQSEFCAEVLQVFLCLGKIVALADTVGQALSASDGHTLDLSSSDGQATWRELSDAVMATVTVADEAYLRSVAIRADMTRSLHGVGCLETLLTVIVTPTVPDAPRNAAYRIFLAHRDLVRGLVTAPDNDEDRDICAFATDVQDGLEAAGVAGPIINVLATRDHPAFLPAWGLLISYILINPEGFCGRVSVEELLKEAQGLVHSVLDAVVSLLPLSTVQSKSSPPLTLSSNVKGSGFLQKLCDLGYPATIDSRRVHAAVLYSGLLAGAPVASRLWFWDIRDKSLSEAIEQYTAACVSKGLLASEYEAVSELAAGLDTYEKFTVKANPAAREVVAVLEVEEGHTLELVVKLPMNLPLRAPEAECRRSVGVTDARLRKWLLSITAYLRNRNGAVAGALKMWKRNADNEFAGHEDCLICYAVLQPATGQLPRLGCRTCRKRFHGTCLYKWFHSSGKSNCPHCQSPW